MVDKKFFRPTEVDYLCGDYEKARNVLGWKPEISFRNLVNEMVRHAMASDLSVDDESAQK